MYDPKQFVFLIQNCQIKRLLGLAIISALAISLKSFLAAVGREDHCYKHFKFYLIFGISITISYV